MRSSALFLLLVAAAVVAPSAMGRRIKDRQQMVVRPFKKGGLMGVPDAAKDPGCRCVGFGDDGRKKMPMPKGQAQDKACTPGWAKTFGDKWMDAWCWVDTACDNEPDFQSKTDITKKGVFGMWGSALWYSRPNGAVGRSRAACCAREPDGKGRPCASSDFHKAAAAGGAGPSAPATKAPKKKGADADAAPPASDGASKKKGADGEQSAEGATADASDDVDQKKEEKKAGDEAAQAKAKIEAAAEEQMAAVRADAKKVKAEAKIEAEKKDAVANGTPPADAEAKAQGDKAGAEADASSDKENAQMKKVEETKKAEEKKKTADELADEDAAKKKEKIAKKGPAEGGDAAAGGDGASGSAAGEETGDEAAGGAPEPPATGTGGGDKAMEEARKLKTLLTDTCTKKNLKKPAGKIVPITACCDFCRNKDCADPTIDDPFCRGLNKGESGMKNKVDNCVWRPEGDEDDSGDAPAAASSGGGKSKKKKKKQKKFLRRLLESEGAEVGSPQDKYCKDNCAVTVAEATLHAPAGNCKVFE